MFSIAAFVVIVYLADYLPQAPSFSSKTWFILIFGNILLALFVEHFLMHLTGVRWAFGVLTVFSLFAAHVLFIKGALRDLEPFATGIGLISLFLVDLALLCLH